MMPSTISSSHINLYQSTNAQAQMPPSLTAGNLNTVRPDVAISDAAARTIPASEFPHGTIIQYTSAQLDMGAVDRADAALMSVIEPEGFQKLVAAIRDDGDWRAVLGSFAQKIPSNPQWLNEEYRLPAARLLEKTHFLMDLSLI
jgi:hypothetical protein